MLRRFFKIGKRQLSARERQWAKLTGLKGLQDRRILLPQGKVGLRECDLWVRGDALHPCDMTDEDCNKVDMDKYCERQNECEDAE